MDICLDTRLLEEIASGNERQKAWFEKAYNDTSQHIYMPYIVLTEFINVSLKKRDSVKTETVIKELERLHKSQMNFSFIAANWEISILAGKIQYERRFGIGDSIIIATAKVKKCRYIRTDQKEFEKVKGIKTFF